MAQITDSPVGVGDLASLVDDPRAGAVVTFSGDVRDHDHGRDVLRLVYEAHPTAPQILADVAADIAARFEVVALAVAHRVGPLAIGDCALAAVVSAAHRGEAFAACSALVDETKARLPVWKHQYFADGTDEWVNCA
jgi:molybdopterin synthase catalytic subunit